MNISLFHRFTGHRHIAMNGEGVLGLADVVNNTKSLETCDILVLQSGPHDYLHLSYTYGDNLGGCMSDCIENYSRNVQALVDVLKYKFPSNSTKTKLFWKSENFYAYDGNFGSKPFISRYVKIKLEARLASLLPSDAVTFVNISEALLRLPMIPIMSEGANIGQASTVISKLPVPLLWSFVSTEVLMNYMCS